MAKRIVRAAYGYDAADVSRGTSLLCEDESLTLQSHAEDADINVIVKRFGLTGELPEGVRVPTYGDFTQVIDFRTAQDALIAARESFMAMPAEVRARFNNDAATFVDFCSDEKNLDEMRRLGLAVPKKEEDNSSRGESNREPSDVKPRKNVRASSQAPGGKSGGDSSGAEGSEGASEDA